MRLAYHLDDEVTGIKVDISSNTLSPEVKELLTYIEKFNGTENVVSVKTGDSIYILPLKDIELIEVMYGEITITSRSKVYVTKGRLYKFLEKNNYESFVQVSKSCVINIKQLVKLETSFSGNMIAFMKSGKTVTVSRGFLPKLKQKVNI
nr:LytTR family DNA-binding domain-containing protein [Clostridioides sp.]